MKRTITWEMFKAIKYQVTEYPADCGMNLAEMFDAVKNNKFNGAWKDICKSDYEEKLRADAERCFWIVSLYGNYRGCYKTVAVVPDFQAAKAIERRLNRNGYVAVVNREPSRWT